MAGRALICALGVLAAKVETWRAATPMLGSEIQTRVTGRIVSVEEANGRVSHRRDLDRPPDIALCAGADQAFGTENTT